MNQQTEQVKKASLAVADGQGRPVQYVNDPSARKEDIARQIAERDGIKQGLVCVLTAVEPCCSFDIHRNRQKKKLELVCRWRKCLHLYHYYQHPQFGLMHMRLQTWFPFNLWCCLNGREWLARQLDEQKIGYRKRENCLVAVEDIGRAQELADEQLRTDWAGILDPIAPRCIRSIGSCLSITRWTTTGPARTASGPVTFCSRVPRRWRSYIHS